MQARIAAASKSAKEPVGVLIGIIDDDKSVRDSISSLLRSEGYGSLVFHSAEAFLETTNRTAADCLVVDLHLPGLSGLQLQGRLLDGGSSCPVVFITGCGNEGARACALSQGAVAFLHKPFSDEDLLGAIGTALKWSKAKWLIRSAP